MEITRTHQGPRMSQAVLYGDTVYLAGQVASHADGSVAEQVREVLGKIDSLLAEAGSSKAKLLAATIYLADLRDFATMNELWDAWVDPHNTPARTTVEAKLARPNLRVEMTVIAAR